MQELHTYSQQAVSLAQRLLVLMRQEYKDGCRDNTNLMSAFQSFLNRASALEDKQEGRRLCWLVKELEKYPMLGLAQRKHTLIQIGQSLAEAAKEKKKNDAEPEIKNTGSALPSSQYEENFDSIGDYQNSPRTVPHLFRSCRRPLYKLEDSAEKLPGIGIQKLSAFKSLQLNTLKDILYYFPKRWENRIYYTSIKNLRPGVLELTNGHVMKVSVQNRRGKSIIEVSIMDESGHLKLVWFNQPYILNKIHTGINLKVYGKTEYDSDFGYSLKMNSPEFCILETESPSFDRIVPIYRLTSGLFQSFMHKFMYNFVHTYANSIKESLPEELIKKYQFMDRKSAVIQMHWPDSYESLRKAQRRMAFEELFALQLKIAGKKNLNQQKPRNVIYKNLDAVYKEFQSILPFTLTKAQDRSIREIIKSLSESFTMNRMLQGDVGSGKTAAAAFTAFAAVKNGFQAAIMAPTEILAEQHFYKFQKLFETTDIKIGRLQGSMTKKKKLQTAQMLEEGQIDIIIGTHAIIQNNVKFAKLGMIIVDEQHKFGVMQRQALKDKSGSSLDCDMLLMTATPIPRTMALTVYGDLELSRIDELPPGRRPIKSKCIQAECADKAYMFALDQIKEGRQVYVICPLINESDKMEAAAAVQEAERLKHSIFKNVRVGLLHGKMKAAEKESVMQDFHSLKYDVLISTTVVEVGVDVPNASVMIIQDANRFGMAQLHQLRGRIGRGSHQSYCFFLSSKEMQSVRKLEAVARLSDGMDVAEEDLNIRGPGDYFGTRQSGFPELQCADLIRDIDLLQTAKQEAPNYINCGLDLDLDFSPTLA